MIKDNQQFKITVNKTNIEHFRKQGYEVELKDTISVAAKDLVPGSHKKIIVICDYCGQEISKEFRRFITGRKNSTKDACYDCAQVKRQEVLQEKYNSDSPFGSQEVRDKSKRTVRERYGVENVMQVKEVKEKLADTLESRYGVRGVLQHPAFLKKARKTTFAKYQTFSSLSVQSIRKKGVYTYVNGVRASKGQMQLGQVLNAEINVRLENGFCLDLVVDETIVLEYNGSGHDLRVKLGYVSQEDFLEKEEKRKEFILKSGLYFIEVNNPRDLKINLDKIKEIQEAMTELSDSTPFIRINF